MAYANSIGLVQTELSCAQFDLGICCLLIKKWTLAYGKCKEYDEHTSMLGLTHLIVVFS